MEKGIEKLKSSIITYLEQTLKEIGLCVGCKEIYDDTANIIGCEIRIVGKPNRKVRVDKSKNFFIESSK